MNRRTTIKQILTLGFLGISSFSIFRWINLHHKIDEAFILSYEELIAELAETIIPLTDTPGAKAAGVENYIINVIVNCTDKVSQNRFLEGIQDLENYAKKTFHRSFSGCNLNERNKILAHFEKKDVYPNYLLNKISNKFFGEPFFVMFKKLTVQGYCYSKIGATQGLAYDYIPGSYESCIPLKLNQKSWATK